MKKAVTVSIEEELLAQLDGLVQNDVYASRSAAMEAAIDALKRRAEDRQLEVALDALTEEDVQRMQAIAEEGMADWSKMVLETTTW